MKAQLSTLLQPGFPAEQGLSSDCHIQSCSAGVELEQGERDETIASACKEQQSLTRAGQSHQGGGSVTDRYGSLSLLGGKWQMSECTGSPL